MLSGLRTRISRQAQVTTAAQQACQVPRKLPGPTLEPDRAAPTGILAHPASGLLPPQPGRPAANFCPQELPICSSPNSLSLLCRAHPPDNRIPHSLPWAALWKTALHCPPKLASCLIP